jgi:hypothetical protein
MLLQSTQSMKTVRVIPSREGRGPSGPGVGCGIGIKPPRRSAPPPDGGGSHASTSGVRPPASREWLPIKEMRSP